MAADPPPSVEDFVAYVNDNKGPFVDGLGLEFDEIGPDRLVAHLDVTERHQQPYGIVHGGVHCAVVETLASVAAAVRVRGDDKAVVGVSNQTEFLRAHREGRLDAVAEPIHAGRLQHLWEVRISRPDDGKLVALGRVRLQVIDLDRELAGSPPAT